MLHDFISLLTVRYSNPFGHIMDKFHIVVWKNCMICSDFPRNLDFGTSQEEGSGAGGHNLI